MAFDLATAQPVSESPEGLKPSGRFDISSARPIVQESNTQETAWERFRKSNAQASADMETATKAMGPIEKTPGLNKESLAKANEFPDHGFLHSLVNLSQDAIYSNFAPALGIKPELNDAVKAEQEQLSAKHPIASIIAGTVPFIATAPLFPQGLLDTTAQFGGLAFLSELGHQKADESLMKPVAQKALDVAKETSKGVLMGPIWHYSGELKFIGRPFAAAIVRAGARGIGTTTLDAVYGNDLTQAFKDGGTMTALSLIFESPYLAKTAIGRGIINHSNNILSDLSVYRGVVDIKIDPESQNVQNQVLDAVKAMAPEIKGKDVELSQAVEVPRGTNKFIKPQELPKIINPETLKSTLGNEGKLDVNLIPGVAEISGGLERASKEYIENLEPVNASEASHFTAADLRERLGKQAQLLDRLEVLLTPAKNMFDKATKESITDTYTRAERGEAQDTPELQKTYDTLKYILNSQKERVRALGKGKLENAIENYLPHIWEDPKRANQLMQYFTRRPFEGSKSFLKKRTIENFADGIEAGLLPVSWNPVDLTMLKVREMEKYIVAHSAIKANIAAGTAKYVMIGQKAPEGWQKLNDNISTVYKSPMTAVNEAFDLHVTDRLNKVAKNLGIDVERAIKIKGVPKSALGASRRGTPGSPLHEDPLFNTSGSKANAGEIKTKFATPESVLAHEIGHQIDHMFGFKEIFLKDKRFTKELRKLADLRFEGREAGESFKKYVRMGSEKMAVMLEAYIHAPDKFKEVAPNSYKAFVEVLGRDPKLEPLLNIKPSLVLGTSKAYVYAGGLVIAGHLYAHPDSARIFNNHLSPGLRGKWLYDVYRGAGNTLNQFQLGMSAFHLGFTSMDATISKFALGINRLAAGDKIGALKEFAKSPLAPVTNFMQGRELLQSWYGKDNGPLTNAIAQAMASGGGRARMDQFYATHAVDSFNKAWKEGKKITLALKAPMWLVEQMSRPIMEYIVPRQKMGVFMDMMKFEMERNPDMSHAQLRDVAQRAWDSVDNRMGQLVYDNLFWNRTIKDMGMASVRSLGWNLGTIRELGGGLRDIKDIGKKGLSYRSAYVLALPAVTALYGAIMQYLYTGRGPEELKDYFFPKTGGVDAKGEPARVSLPTYMKDIYHYTQNPVQTVINKFSPVNSMVAQMLANRDYYGTEIHNADDPIVRQILDEIGYVGHQFVPFGVRNLERDTRKTASSKIEPFIGITPAPYDINMTKAEKHAYELGKGKIPIGSRTKEQAEHSKQKATLRNDYMDSKDATPLTQAVRGGLITAKEKKEIIKTAKMTSLGRLTQHLTLEEIISVLKKATDEERPELLKIVKNKRNNLQEAGVWTAARKNLYDKAIGEFKK